MKNYSLGVIGGMGSKATSVFFDRVIAHTVAESDQEHLNMIILNHATLPDRTETIMNGEAATFLRAISQDIELLQHAGISHIAIPCNTSHVFYSSLQEMSSVPIIHMVEETTKVMQRRLQLKGKRTGPTGRVGLLATNGTVRSGTYADAFERNGLELYVPSEDIQQQVMQIIYHQVKAQQNFDSRQLEAIILQLINQEQCDGVILACTELSCIPLPPEIQQHCVDALDVLVHEAITRSGKKVQGLDYLT